MPFIYRYLTPKSGKVLYVGKTNGTELLAVHARVSCHKSEEKFKHIPASSVVEYAEVHTAADADILETILISVYDPPLNTAKTGWGKTSVSIDYSLHWRPLGPRSNPRLHDNDIMRDFEDPPKFLRYRCCHCSAWVEVKRAPYHLTVLSRKDGLGTFRVEWAMLCPDCVATFEDEVNQFLKSRLEVKASDG